MPVKPENSQQATVLVVEDDDIVRTLLAASLEHAGHRVVTARSGEEMSKVLRQEPIALILLDLGLPDEDGMVLLRQLRMRSDAPVVVLTSRNEADTRRAALELGVDDFIGKDTPPDEILLRIRNILRRTRGGNWTAHHEGPAASIEFSGWFLDPAERSLTSPTGVEVTLTAGEFDILCCLARAPNRVLSRNQLIDALMRSDEGPMDRMIDSYVSRIRRKMGDSRFIVTVTGVGYRFVPSPG